MFPAQPNQEIADNPQDLTEREFVSYVRSQLSQTMGEVAARNTRIQENDAYIYGDLLEKMLDIPIGHDRTNVNWLRRAVEIHRAQFMGRGFTVASTYTTEDENTLPVDPQTNQPDPQAKQMLDIENDKRKQFAEKRRQLIEAVLRDNGSFSFWAQGAENASAIGDFIVKGWYDDDEGKYHLAPVDAVEHCYALWKKNDFREWDLFAYVYQVSKDEAQRLYNVGPDVQTSPLGLPLAVLSTANTVEYISTQPMVTIMEVTGLAEGWGTDGNGRICRKTVGEENPLNAVIVGTKVHKLIDDPKKLPKYYIFPNKKQRRRPWGMPDISKQAVNINITYIEAFSDWRELAAKVRFPKFKYLGFPFGSQLPPMQPRKAEGIPLIEGQDIQPLEMPNSAALGERGYPVQLDEIKSEFVREVGIGRVLFDAPDVQMDSGRALQQAAFKTISDITSSKQQLWEPIMTKMFSDILETLSLYDDTIKDLVTEDDWNFKIQWPSMLHQDDPAWHAIQLNRFNANLISVQSYLESIGVNAREEIDRLKSEMEDKTLSAIHGRLMQLLAEFNIAGPPTSAPPKINVNLRGDITPEQETNLSVLHQFGQGPVYGPSSGPQGELGIRATDDAVNGIGSAHPTVTGQGYQTGQPVIQGGQPVNNGQGAQPNSPQQVTTPSQNTPGTQPVSQPGSGAPNTTPQGKLAQKKQQSGG
jgi:hypothetical protein